ncbi:nitronate monooxygenase [Arthrobacter bambusae]
MTEALDIKHPIVLAPMDYVSDASLAAAVSGAGGLGLIGGGYGDREWLIEQFDRVKPGSVGCGFITWALGKQPELLDIALERGPKAIFLSFGDPSPYVEKVRDAGVPLICQVHNVEQARRALDLGVDALSAQGAEAGGHGLGTRSTFTLVPEVADLISSISPQTLLLAAGGVGDGRGLAAALALGADGALVGTRFYATNEAAISRQAHATALRASGDDTVRSSVYDIVREKAWPTEYNGRVLRNDFVSRWHGHEPSLAATLGGAQEEFKSAVDNQDYTIANLIVGEVVGQINRILPAAQVVDQMIKEAGTRLTA